MSRTYLGVGLTLLLVSTSSPAFAQSPPTTGANPGETSAAPGLNAPATPPAPVQPAPSEEMAPPAVPPPPPAAAPPAPPPLAVPPPPPRAEDGSGPDEGPPPVLGRKVVIGGYGSLDVAYTRMFGKDGALVGLEGALLFNHRLSIGIAGYGWTNPQSGPTDWDGAQRRFETGYLGGTLRYSVFGDFPAYLTIGGLVGGGVTTLAREHNGDWDSGDDDWDERAHDTFFVFQPDVAVHVNLLPWLRMGAMAGYRFTAGVGRFGFSESDVNGVVVGGHLQIGRF